MSLSLCWPVTRVLDLSPLLLLLLLDRYHLTHISLLLMTSAAAIITHLGRNIPRVPFLQWHALYIPQNIQFSPKFCRQSNVFVKQDFGLLLKALQGCPGCLWVALRGDSGGMWGVAGGPPTSDSLFTHDPKGNPTAININPTSLCTNNTNAVSGSPTSTAGVPDLPSLPHNLVQCLTLCLSGFRVEWVHRIILFTTFMVSWHFSPLLLSSQTLASEASKGQRIREGQAFVLHRH